jgi:glutamate dehydrogenase (NAD(P)+)
MSDQTLNPFVIAQQQLDMAAEKLRLDPSIHEALRWPMRELHIHFPVRMDDGTAKVFHGFRVQYNDARGPCKGGLRFHPAETIDTVRALAAWMTWKTALLDLPLGGGKGGVVCNPKELSATEKERVCRGYIGQVGRILGLSKDVPAPDVYTNPQDMAWMMDEYEKITGYHEPGVITGKPLPLGGSAGRGDATARGGIFTVREAAKVLGINTQGSTCAIQGFGNAGQFAATLAQKILGSKVVAVSDSRGGIYNERGMDAQKLVDYKLKTGKVADFGGAKEISNEEILELDVDVLYPSALENVITKDNAGNIKAKIVAELANGPTTPQADEILFKNGVFDIPDFLCNAGGVTVSYFECVQNAYNYYWDENEVHQRLDQRMTKSFHDVYNMQQKHNVHMRMAAYMVAIERVAEAMRLRGWV